MSDQVQDMAVLVEKWLGNPVSRSFLRFCTAECSCGNRLDLALKAYAGEKQKMCLKCRLASKVISSILDYFAGKNNVKKKDIVDGLKYPLWRNGFQTVMKGISEFGVKRPFTGSAPFLVVWNITKACNLRCKHCYEDAHIKAKDELSTEEALQAVDRMAEEGIAYVAISGGEPLSRPDFFEIAERLKEKEVALSIATNATLITPEIAKRLKAVDCMYAQVSVDGANAKTHNAFRGKDSFEKTINGIKNLLGENIFVGISCTVTKHNLKQFPKMIDLAENLGVQFLMHYNFIPTGRGKEIVSLDITPQEREDLLLMLAEQNGKRKVGLLSTAPQFARVCSGFAKASLTHFDVFSSTLDNPTDAAFLADFIGGCGAGRLYICLEPNGDILPCVFIQKKLGNIKTSNFKKIWRENPDLLALRDRKSFGGNCGKCKFQNSCGGCRARSFGYYGSLTGPDPGCILNKSVKF